MKKIVVIFICFLFVSVVYAKTTKLIDIDCVDGDTFRTSIDGNEKTIRLIGIDTPETKYSTKTIDEPYAVEATNYTCSKLKDAKEITLEYDPKANSTDKYGRVLGWIFVDDELLQKQLVTKGYAKVAYVYDDYLYIDELYKAQDNAKASKVGIWSDENIDIEETSLNKTIMDEIVDYISDKIKELFEIIFENIKNCIKNILKDKFE